MLLQHFRRTAAIVALLVVSMASPATRDAWAQAAWRPEKPVEIIGNPCERAGFNRAPICSGGVSTPRMVGAEGP